MHFSVKGGDGVPPRIAGGGGNGAPKTMNKYEGGDEGGNGATTTRRDTVINLYAKQSIPGGFINGGGERGHIGSRKGTKSSGHGGKRKGYGEKLNIKKDGPSKTGHGSLMHNFGRSVIVADVGIEEGA